MALFMSAGLRGMAELGELVFEGLQAPESHTFARITAWGHAEHAFAAFSAKLFVPNGNFLRDVTLSHFAVPVGKVPSTENALTGKTSPRRRSPPRPYARVLSNERFFSHAVSL
jgi:hypothetical protein